MWGRLLLLSGVNLVRGLESLPLRWLSDDWILSVIKP